MAKQKYWNGTAWEVVGTDAAKVTLADSANHFTATDVEGALAELFQNVSDGKISVRDAITGKGSTVADADGDGVPTFTELVTGINAISTGKRWASGTATSSSSSKIWSTQSNSTYSAYSVSVTGLTFTPSFIWIVASNGAAIYTFYDENLAYPAGTENNPRFLNSSPLVVNSTSFVLPLEFSNYAVRWQAYE